VYELRMGYAEHEGIPVSEDVSCFFNRAREIHCLAAAFQLV